MKATKRALTDLLPYALPAAAGLVGLLLAPVVGRWVEQFDVWMEGRLKENQR